MIKDFLYAAFSWVVIGLNAALFAVYAAKEKNTENKEDRNAKQMAIGICFGLLAGIGAGAAGIVSMALGVSMGMLLGLTAGLCFEKK